MSRTSGGEAPASAPSKWTVLTGKMLVCAGSFLDEGPAGTANALLHQSKHCFAVRKTPFSLQHHFWQSLGLSVGLMWQNKGCGLACPTAACTCLCPLTWAVERPEAPTLGRYFQEKHAQMQLLVLRESEQVLFGILTCGESLSLEPTLQKQSKPFTLLYSRSL